MIQATLQFDSVKSRAAKAQGMDQAAERRRVTLELAREGLRKMARARIDRCVTADDAQRYLEELGYPPGLLGNAAGSLFRGADWRWTGRWIRSARVQSHANDLRVWEYIGG